jgi:hypothetical protein
MAQLMLVVAVAEHHSMAVLLLGVMAVLVVEAKVVQAMLHQDVLLAHQILVAVVAVVLGAVMVVLMGRKVAVMVLLLLDMLALLKEAQAEMYHLLAVMSITHLLLQGHLQHELFC